MLLTGIDRVHVAILEDLQLRASYNRPLFVVGMHRSGTTMVTRALHDAGVFSGALLDHNQAPLFAIDINETLLNDAGGTWWQPPVQMDLERVMAKALPNLKAPHLFSEFINKPVWRAAGAALISSRWALKDPRLCLTLPWWFARFPRAKVLWVQRDPAAIVDSLLRRQDLHGEAQSELTATTAATLVERYDSAAVRSIKSTGMPHMTVHYEALTSIDSAEQRRAWTALYEYAGVNCGKSAGFSARGRSSSLSSTAKTGNNVRSPNEESRVNPLVSVIVPNYNHAPFLDERIQSIVNQSYRNIEILLMDDFSLDGSREILESWARKDARISILFNDENSGSPFHQWKIGADWASGEYLWIAESDDVAELDMLKLHVEALERNKSAVIAYSQSAMIDQFGREIGSWNKNYESVFASSLRWRARFTMSGPSEVAERMVFSNTIPNASGTLIRKSAFDRAGLPEVTWRLNGDWLFYSRLLQLGDVEYFPEGRNKFRHHPQTQRVIANKSSSTYFEVIALLRIYEIEKWTDAESLLAARRQVTGWWVNAMFHMPLSLKNIRDNIQLYREFSRFEPRIFRNLIITFVKKAWRWTRRKLDERPDGLQREPAAGQFK